MQYQIYNSMARKNKNIKLRKRFVVLGDGRTEQYYLEHLKIINNYGYSVKPSLFDNITLSQAEEIIDELLKGGCDKIIFITDYDTIVNQNKKIEFDRLSKKYKNNSAVLICETMPSIEFWFLLHFTNTTKHFQNAKEVQEFLEKYIPNYSKEHSFLKNIKWVEILCSDKKLDKAITNATKILKEKDNHDSSSFFPFSKIHLAINCFERLKIK